jgi:hypothetical protein
MASPLFYMGPQERAVSLFVIVVVQAMAPLLNILVELVKDHRDHSSKHCYADYIEHIVEMPSGIPLPLMNESSR